MNELAQLKDWEGRTETLSDILAPQPVRALAALLDRDCKYEDGDELPPPAHWLYFLPAVRQSELGEDGHPRRGGFLPPVSLPRRMWAGSRIDFHEPLGLGEKVSRTSRIVSVSGKHGRSGQLIFVKVAHEIHGAAGLAIAEEQDIVYRDVPGTGSVPEPTSAPAEPKWTRGIVPDPVLLFRYSALTFNGHRIHYDWPYATRVEQYPALVVHGPLIATLLIDLLRRALPGAKLRHFSFRAIMPLFADGRPFAVCGKPDQAEPAAVQLWAQDERGMLVMQARALLA